MNELVGDRLPGIPSDGTVYNSPQLVNGPVDNALRFTGYPQYAILGDYSNECYGDTRLCAAGFTLSLMMKFDSAPSAVKFYASSGGQTQWASFGIIIYHDATNNLKVDVRFDPKMSSTYQPAAKVPVGRWFHVVVTWAADGALTLYTDDQASATYNLATYTKQPGGDYTKWVLGTSNNAYAQAKYSHLSGAFYVDDMIFWDEQKSRDFVSNLSNTTLYRLAN